MKSCMWATVHLDQERDENKRGLRNIIVEDSEQKKDKVLGLHGQLKWNQSPWKSCTVLHNDFYKQFKAKVYVFSASLLSLGGRCTLLRSFVQDVQKLMEDDLQIHPQTRTASCSCRCTTTLTGARKTTEAVVWKTISSF